MAVVVSELFAFFGVTSAPTCFSEFVPWFFQVLISLGLFLYLFGMIKSLVAGIQRSERW